MKKYGFWCLTFLLLTSCAHTVSKQGQDAARENWHSQMNLQPDDWTREASPWFFSGKINQQGLSKTWQLSACSNVINYLNFPVHISYSENKPCELTIVGDVQARQAILARVNQQNLSFELNPNVKEKRGYVEIYLRVPALTRIEQKGNGTIEARNIHASPFSLKQSGDGNIYLSGNINLMNLTANGQGRVVLLGARAQQLDLKTDGEANIYLNGRLEIQNIEARGSSDLTIIGAYGQNIQISANENSHIRLQSYQNTMDVHRLYLESHAQVFLEGIKGVELTANLYGQSYAGASGQVGTLTINAHEEAQFAGIDLQAQDVFARADGGAHINVRASNKIFAAARDRSTIYYFGDPARLSAFTFSRGLVLPIDLAKNAGYESSFSLYRPYSYRKDSIEQTYYRQKGLHRIGEK